MVGAQFLFRYSVWARNATQSRKWLVFIALLGALSGCVSSGSGHVEPPGVANQVRSQIQKLAIRGPGKPTISLTNDLDSRGKATGKAALSAGLGWLNLTMQAAAEADEAGIFVLAAGLITTPVAAAGGAFYGAAASDSAAAIVDGNQTLETILEFAPARMRRILKQAFSDAIPVHFEFSGDVTDAELAALGFDAVLDIHMDSLSSAPSENQFHVWFSSANRAELRVFGRPDLTRQQTYDHVLSSRAVSGWARDGGAQLLNALDESYETTAEGILDYFFLKNSIQVQGLEPVSRGWRVGRIPGTRPMFAWSARDGQLKPETGEVEYELLVYQGREPPGSGIRTQSTYYVPDESLTECRLYSWQVRAHYESFGRSTSSDWSPVYRFKTECKKRNSTRSEQLEESL